MATRLRTNARFVGKKCGDFAKESCTVDNVKSKFPITQWLPKYKPKWLISDFIAGITVGLTVLPQGLAYATVAKLPLEYGLYTAFMGSFVYCFMGTAKDVTLGPTVVMGLLVATFSGETDRQDGLHNPVYAIVITFFCGLVQIAMGIFHLGFLVNFISHPVITAFTSAAAVIIGVGQLRHIFGIPKFQTTNVIETLYKTAYRLPHSRWQDVLMGFTCFVLLVIIKNVKDKFSVKKPQNAAQTVLYKAVWLIGTARNAIMVILAASVAYGFHINGNTTVFVLVGHVPAGLPPFQPPIPPYLRHMPLMEHVNLNMSIVINETVVVQNDTVGYSQATLADSSREYVPLAEIMTEIGLGLIIIPIISFLESIACAKAFARKNNYRVYPNQELLALGTTNVMGSFVSAYPVTGSFTRSAVNSQSGVKTQLGGIFTGCLALLSLAVFTPLFYFIPKSALAAVIIYAISQMFDYATVRKIWKINKIDLLPWLGTFIGSLVQGVEIGIIIGIGVDICMLLYKQAKPDMKVKEKEVTVIEIEAGVYFPAVEHVTDTVKGECIEGEHAKSAVVDASRVAHIDYTSILAIKELFVEFSQHEVKLALAGLKPELLSILHRENITDFEHYDTEKEAVQYLKENLPDATHVPFSIGNSKHIEETNQEEDNDNVK